METIAGERPIGLQSLQIKSEISGGMAETALQMVFYNPNRRPLEGNLQFPLLPGQQVVGFSLDIKGKLRAAVPVEKSKGRQVFEAIERRGADPALLELTQGNNFKLRIYPVPAGGTRTVLLKYAETLAAHGKERDYRLPLDYAGEVGNFSLDVKVGGADAAPRVTGMRELAFAAADNGYAAHLEQSHVTPNRMLDIAVPVGAAPQVYVQEFRGSDYFLVEVPAAAEARRRHLPRSVGLLWDSSGSGAGRHTGVEFEVLDAYFKALGNGEVRLTRLRDRPEPVKVYRVTDGKWNELRKELEQTVYDGASALGDWKPESAVGEYLLFSDGLQNYGSEAFPALAKGQRLYALNSAAAADAARLSALSMNNGGRYIQIDARAPETAVRALLDEACHLSELRAEGASDLQAESDIPDQGVLRIAGKLTRPGAKLHLTLDKNGVPTPIDVEIPAQAPAHPLAAYFWASYRLHALEAERGLRRGEIQRLGREFGIPTSETSLIVLESMEDYLRYEIEPPQEERAEYDSLSRARWNVQRDMQRQHLESLVQKFKERQAWWNTKFPRPENAAAMRKPAPDADMMPERAMSVPMVTAPPPPPPPPSPRAAAPVMAMPMVESRIAPVRGTAVAREERARDADRNAGDALQRAPAAAFAAQRSERAAKKPAGSPDTPAQSTIALKPWSANAPYIARMKAAPAERLYAIYLDEKPSYANSSAFFLDAADILLEKGQRELGLRVLSNLAEMDLENRQVLRILGYRLMEAGVPELAIGVLRKVQQLAEDEPQSFRDLGLAYAAAGRYQEAVDQLNELSLRNWDGRFQDIDLIAVDELNAIVATKNSVQHPLDLARVDPRLLKNLPLDLRVVMTWDADDSDMDLWVTDPSGEKCFYGHNATVQGGRISQDVTQGYGPEEFILRHAAPGKYRIEANFYGNRQQVVAGATTVQVKLTTGFGSARAEDKMKTLRLRDNGDTVLIGEFEVK